MVACPGNYLFVLTFICGIAIIKTEFVKASNGRGLRFLGGAPPEGVVQCGTRLCYNSAVCQEDLSCQCSVYFTGPTCSQDVNECESETHLCQDHECINFHGGYSCDCTEGYELHGSSHSCIDVDECAGTDACSQTCINMDGGYDCECGVGYVLNADGVSCDDDFCYNNNCAQSCLNDSCFCDAGYTLNDNGSDCDDVDECIEEVDDCSQICVNLAPGSYRCECGTGYADSVDGRNCDDVNECAAGNDDCEDTCINMTGTYRCECLQGRSLNSDGTSCDDIVCYDHYCSHDCIGDSEEGGFICECDAGYNLNIDGLSCDDVDECVEGSDGCSQTCVNSEGSYSCDCGSGYSLNGDGASCDDLDECSEGTNGCAQTCINLTGTYSCACGTGYTLNDDRVSCDDVNECAAKDGTDCEQICVNVAGGYQCSCYPGSALNANGLTCDGIDGCVGNNCAQECVDDNVGGFSCSCGTGYTLNGDGTSCNDVDECTAGTDNCGVTCVNTEGSYWCECGPGYTLNEASGCDDVDECGAGTHNCEETCVNTEGSFSCECGLNGSTLNVNGASCDVPVCAEHNCEQYCNDDESGSYFCSCDDGYTLSSNLFHCDDIDECATGNNNCDQTCVNFSGGYGCECGAGYMLNPDFFTCDDRNECDLGTNECQDACINLTGSYRCECPDGYSLNADGASCDEIVCYNHNCAHDCEDDNAGGFACTCHSGFTLNGDGTSCYDVDECSSNTDECSQTCVNLEGGYCCECGTGYTVNEVDTTLCNDVDECSSGSDDCQDTCINMTGGYRCECPNGYSLNANGASCDDVDECSLDTDNCGQTCSNTEGGFNCSCNSGYVLNEDGATCNDVDECVLAAHNCTHTCSNTAGGYTCSCNTGYTLDGDSATCDDKNECVASMIKGQRKISNLGGGLTTSLPASSFLGYGLGPLGDLDGDGVVDMMVSAIGETTSAGSVRVMFLRADGTIKGETVIKNGVNGKLVTLDDYDYFGIAIANLGDLDGDGVVDVAVGASNDDDGGNHDRANVGAVYIMFMRPDGTVKAEQKISALFGGISGMGLVNGDGFGNGLAGLGDLDGDGVLDLAVGAPGDDSGGVDTGAMYVLFLRVTGTVKSWKKISSDQNGMATISVGSMFGKSSASIGDLDGDGVVDLGVGAYSANDGADGAGAAYVLFMKTDGTVKRQQRIGANSGGFSGAGLEAWDRFGSDVTGLGDIDGDGVLDMAVSAFADDDGGTDFGAVYILFLNTDGTVKGHQKISALYGGFTGVLKFPDSFGISIANLGDVNGDGALDMGVGAFLDASGATNAGAVWVAFGVPTMWTQCRTTGCVNTVGGYHCS